MNPTNTPEISAAAPAKGIWFGNFCFSEPALLPCFVPASNSGVFAILVSDPSYFPRSWRPLYFGESENIPAYLTPWHEKYAQWCEIAGSAIKLYVAFLPLDSADDRRAVLADLIAQYQPESNVTS